jgi:hypothetical protein
MSDETEVNDPFAPQESGVKTKFGKLKLFANPVTLESGASYQIKGVHDRDGNTRDWKGKKIDKASKRYHIVMHVLADDKDGNEYEMSRDMLSNDKAYTGIVYPSLVKVFGKSVDFPRDKYAFVKLEEAPTGETFTGREGNEVNKTTWRIVAKYGNEAAMKAAEKEYFSRFSNGNNHAEPEAASEDGLTFSEDLVKAFKKNAKKGAAKIVEDYVDDAIIAKYGVEVVTAAVEKLIA